MFSTSNAQHATSPLWMGGAGSNPFRSQPPPLVLTQGQGIYLFDDSGRRYIDAIASLETCAVGHGRAEIADAVADQMAKLDFYDTLRHTSDVTLRLAERLTDLAPDPLNHVHFATSGSEAVEASIKLARQYHLLAGNSGKYKVVARRGAYHGCTFGAMAVDGGYYRTRRNLFEPLPALGRFVTSSNVAREFADLIDLEGAETVSAILVDPMATASGVFPPPPGYWLELRQICDERNVLLIADEAITGFGRTGEWFGSDRESVVPDIMTVSKGLTSGYLPMSAMLVADRVAEPFDGEDERVLFHGHTFSGHPVAAAAALRNLELIESEGLVERARSLELVMRDEMARSFDASHPVAEVRGSGLLFGVELKGNESRTSGDVARVVLQEMRQRGALAFVLHPGDVLFLCPPLVISAEEVRELVHIVADSLSVVAG